MITPRSFAFTLWFCLIFVIGSAQERTDSIITPPPPQEVACTAYELSYSGEALQFRSDATPDGWTVIRINGEADTLSFRGGTAALPFAAERKGGLLLIESPGTGKHLYHLSIRTGGLPRLQYIPLWLSILPPLVAIGLALIFKEVLISLFVGVWAGAFIAGGMRFESPAYYLTSIWSVVERYIIEALTDRGHLAVIIFSLLIGGMVAIISRNGGMAGIVEKLSRFARTPRSAQFVTWLLGVAIFFDDYANTLIVGNTMRPITDRFRISREKLAYIVDSTAAPVAAVAFITTWIGAELGYIADGIKGLEGFGGGSAYAVFLSSLKYSFYPLLTLAFMLILILRKRDFGPMFKAEQRARREGVQFLQEGAGAGHLDELEPVKGIAHRGYRAFIPVILVITVTFLGLLVTGFDSSYEVLIEAGIAVPTTQWSEIWGGIAQFQAGETSFFTRLGYVIGNADSYTALLWSSLTGVLAAVFLSLGGRVLKLTDTMNTLVTGFKTMMPALLILVLAWSLALTTEQLHTADFLSASLKDALNPYWMPVLIFVLAALISFSTGSSWSTMAILYPIAIPLTWTICQTNGLDAGISTEILLNVIAGVLGASVLGDHCSPISDTTILSSLASDCNHIDHVRTQLPYALTVGLVSMSCAGLSTWLGGGGAISALLILAGIALFLLIVWKFGKVTDE
jgi:Na+/H+ antiporter NhaC